MTRRRRLIGVIGGGTVDEGVAAAAREVGYELGRRALSLVCGGRGGVMAAACEGLYAAREEHHTDAVSIGILPGTDLGEANPFVDFCLPTGMGIGRNILVVRAAEAVIAVDGSSGTLSELAFAWQLDKPIVALATSGGVVGRLAGTRIDDRRNDTIMSAESPAEAVAMAMRALGIGEA